MAAHQRLGQDLIAELNRIHHARAGLRLDIDANRTERQLALKGAACHRGRGGEQRHMFHIHLTRGGIVAPLPFSQSLDQGHEDPKHPLVGGHPCFLHPLQRRRTRGVACQDHQIAALGPKPLGRGTGQVEDVLMGPHPIGRMGIVAEIDKGHIRQPPRHRIQNRQPAKTRIKDANRHTAPRRVRLNRPALILPPIIGARAASGKIGSARHRATKPHPAQAEDLCAPLQMRAKTDESTEISATWAI